MDNGNNQGNYEGNKRQAVGNFMTAGNHITKADKVPAQQQSQQERAYQPDLKITQTGDLIKVRGIGCINKIHAK